MPNPKRKHSKTRSRTRRAQYMNKVSAPQMIACSQCGNTKMMHHVCPNCGHYRGRKLTEVKKEA
jgi:large subunit ribosomal protein L32